MTREEQIAVASCAYGARGSSIDFIAGAKWADNHPKSPWISVEEDLPCNHKELITTDGYFKKETMPVITVDKCGIIEDNYMILCDDGKWVWKYGALPCCCAVPYYWMLIPKLPKE